MYSSQKVLGFMGTMIIHSNSKMCKSEAGQEKILEQKLFQDYRLLMRLYAKPTHPDGMQCHALYRALL